MNETGGPEGFARRAFRRHWRTAFLVCGLGAVVSIVRAIGPEKIGRALLSAGMFLPLLMLLEAAWMSMDVFVLRSLLGDHARRVPWLAYARSGVTAYAVTVFFPMGRASAEVTRAAMISPHLGAGRVALAAMEMQGASMLGTTSISLCALMVTSERLGPTHPLALAIGASALLTGSLGAALLFGSRSPRLWTFLQSASRASRASIRQRRIPRRGWVARSCSASWGARSSVCSSRPRSMRRRACPRWRLAPSRRGVARRLDVRRRRAAAGGHRRGRFLLFRRRARPRGTPAKAVAIAILVRVCQPRSRRAASLWAPSPGAEPHMITG